MSSLRRPEIVPLLRPLVILVAFTSFAARGVDDGSDAPRNKGGGWDVLESWL